jgi:hypothetical protein
MTDSARFQRFQQLASLALVVLLAVLVGRYLSRQWDQIDQQMHTIQGPWLLLAGLGFVVGLGTLPVNTWLVLRCLGIALPIREVMRIFFLSQVAKYLPGSIWTLPSRAFFYTRRQVPGSKSIAAVIWEVVLMIAGAVLIAVLGSGKLAEETFLPAAMLALGVLLVGMFVLSVVLKSARVRELGTRLPLPERVSANMLSFMTQLSPQRLGLMTLAYAFSWMVIGLAFMTLAYAVQPDIDAADWLSFAGLFAGAWVIGFLSFITPGGIGVRDGLLVWGLGAVLGDPLPFLVAVLARILWTIAEVIGLVGSLLVYRFFPPQVIDWSSTG